MFENLSNIFAYNSAQNIMAYTVGISQQPLHAFKTLISVSLRHTVMIDTNPDKLCLSKLHARTVACQILSLRRSVK